MISLASLMQRSNFPKILQNNSIRLFTTPTRSFEKNKFRIEETLKASGILKGSHMKLEDFFVGNFLSDRGETVEDVFKRCARFLAQSGEVYYGQDQQKHEKNFYRKLLDFKIILGTPILSHAFRRDSKSTSSCAIPSVNFSKMTFDEILRTVSSYHTLGMGTGYDFSDLENPNEVIKLLNTHAVKEVQEQTVERPVGNMATLSIEHPLVIDFIRIKKDHPKIRDWKFNLSVNMTKEFVDAWFNNTTYIAKNGQHIDPQKIVKQIAENAHATGDPGVVFMDRINELNRVPQLGSLKTVVPCGEVALHEGEVCQFGYINLIQFLEGDLLNKEELKKAVKTLVLMLDNAIEANISRMPNSYSSEVISSLRRIGIGICGFAELLQAKGISYASEEARVFARNIMSFINFHSKWASVELAMKRGPFPQFDHMKTRKELFINPFFDQPTSFVTKEDWNSLGQFYNCYKIRNLSTTIIPPSGKTSLIAGVTGSIEPPFKLINDALLRNAIVNASKKHVHSQGIDDILKHVEKYGTLQNTDLPIEFKSIFLTALEVSSEDHIKMTAAFQKNTDEGIAKTVNLPYDASVQDVERVLYSAYRHNLKGITVYRNGSRQFQPKMLSKTSKSHTLTNRIVEDTIYGPIKVSKRVARLIQSPVLQRLKTIHQNGAYFLIDPNMTTSRFEHSLGVMSIVKLIDGDESSQISALLHDLSHTVFSHVGDSVLGYTDQDYHTKIYKEFIATEEVQKVFKDCGVTSKEIEYASNPLFKGDLNPDRLDYAIRDLVKSNRINQSEYTAIINDLVIDMDGQIVFSSLESARLFFKKFLQVNKEVYFNSKVEVANIVLSFILKSMLEEGLIKKQDLFSNDLFIMNKILESRFKSLFESIRTELSFNFSDKRSDSFLVTRKLRYVDPKIMNIGKLTNNCEASNQELTRYLKTETELYYDIPAIKPFI